MPASQIAPPAAKPWHQYHPCKLLRESFVLRLSNSLEASTRSRHVIACPCRTTLRKMRVQSIKDEILCEDQISEDVQETAIKPRDEVKPYKP